MPDDRSGAALLRAVGLMPDGPGVLGRPIRAGGSGVYVVELPAPLPRAPLDLSLVGKWIERLPGLRLDGQPPTSKALAARLASFWIPSMPVLFVGSSEKSIAGRIQALERHVLGDRQPHASSQWLKALRIDGLRVWWAATDAPEEYEDAVLAAFGERVPAEERAALPDTSVVLPFANLRTPSGGRKATGITGAVVPEDRAAPPPPTRIVELPPGDADGLPEARNAGTTRRTNPVPPPPAGVRRPKATTPRGRSTAVGGRAPSPTAAAASRPPVEGVQLTPEGHARLVEEHRVLTQERRPEVIERIKRARELGDLRENADYTAAREEQSFLEGRVQAIEAQLRFAVVVAPSDGSRVDLGSRVVVEQDGEEQAFTIVGPAESDPSNGRISSVSPVGRALLGKAAGEEAVVATPRGAMTYRIVSIG
jgi:transcription elongation factor GreA